MNVSIVFIAIISVIVAVGAVIGIVLLIRNRRNSRVKEHISDEETQLGIGEQYRRMYNDGQESNLK